MGWGWGRQATEAACGGVVKLQEWRGVLIPSAALPCDPAVNGYEGTGRSLSLKLIQQLRQQGAKLASGGSGGEGRSGGDDGAAGVGGMGRTFREVILAEPIR